MVDSIRTYNDLINTYLPDNGANQISAQDIRDMLKSIWQNTQHVHLGNSNTPYNITIDGTQAFICYAATGVDFSAVLPLASATDAGATVTIVKGDNSANAVVISGNGTNIVGAATLSLSAQGDNVTLMLTKSGIAAEGLTLENWVTIGGKY